MIKRLLILSVVFLMAVPTLAQWHRRLLPRRYSVSRQESELARRYADSLKLSRARIDSIGADAHGTTTYEGARLLMPTTFYHDVAHRLFNIDENPSASDIELMRIYMNHPELVVNSDDRLDSKGKRRVKKPSEAILPENELTEQVAENPIEPTVEPVRVMIRKPNFWTYHGDFGLQLMQNYVSGNWYKGGESNYSALGNITLEANYNNKQKLKWENRLELRYGMLSSQSDSIHNFKTTEDLIRLTSKLGVQATKRWYYTLQMIAYTQFSNSFKANDYQVYSTFMAPFNLNISIGMDYSVDWLKHRLKGTIHLAPFAYNMKYTRRRDLAERLGIGTMNHVLNDYGSELNVDLEWKLLEGLSWKTRLYAYTTYDRVEAEWENTFNLQLTRYIGAQLFIYPRFDDGVARDEHHGYMQFKEYASIGFSYSF